MKYLVVNSKHHDALRCSTARPGYNVVKTYAVEAHAVREPPRRGRRAASKFGVYYSLGPDWKTRCTDEREVTATAAAMSGIFLTRQKKTFKIFERKVKPQVREL